MLKKQEKLNMKICLPKTASVSGDGHCGYRSLSLLLTGDADQHLEVRKKICDYILTEKKNRFQKSLCRRL